MTDEPMVVTDAMRFYADWIMNHLPEKERLRQDHAGVVLAREVLGIPYAKADVPEEWTK